MAKLYFQYAAMNAGKSTALLQASFNYRERGMETFILTAAIDTRSEKGTVASRIGLKSDAHNFDTETDLFSLIDARIRDGAVDCIFVDEAQFLTGEQVMQLARVADELNTPVMCFGLRTDFRGALFPGSARLLAIADDIRELKAICHCGRKATMNLRTDEKGNAVTSGEQVEVGGNDRYTALCRKHFYAAIGSYNLYTD